MIIIITGNHLHHKREIVTHIIEVNISVPYYYYYYYYYYCYHCYCCCYPRLLVYVSRKAVEALKRGLPIAIIIIVIYYN